MIALNSFLKTWRDCLRHIPELERYREEGIANSYPLFAWSSSGLLARHFYHLAQQSGPNSLVIGAPHALVTLKAADLSLVSLQGNAFAIQPFENTEYRVSPAEQQTLRSQMERLKLIYDRILESYPKPPSTTLASEFFSVLFSVVPPTLWPYYKVLAPDFIAWVEGRAR